MSVWDKIWQESTYRSPTLRSAKAAFKLACLDECGLEVPRGSRVFDLGTGDGSVARAITSRYEAKVIGVDASPDAIRLAEASGSGNPSPSYLRGDVTSPTWAIQGPPADVLFMVGLLEHVRDPRASLLRALGGTTPTARIAIVWSNRRSVFALERRVRQALRLWPFGYQSEITREGLEELLSSVGVSLGVARVFADDVVTNRRWTARLDRLIHKFNKRYGRFVVAVAHRE